MSSSFESGNEHLSSMNTGEILASRVKVSLSEVSINQNHRICPSSGILTEITTFLKVDLFPSSDDARETPNLLGPLQRANLNDWASHAID
jgi:hypothetical protein